MHDGTTSIGRPFRIAVIAMMALAIGPGLHRLAAQQSFVATHFGVFSSDKEVPPNDDGGDGVAIFRFNPTTSSLEYRISVTFQGSDTITVAHFHTGNEGVSGPPIHDIPFAPGSLTAAGTWENISAQDLQTLGNAGMYVNVHTKRHPNGQIRAQVVPLPNLLSEGMTPQRETPPVTGSSGSGTCSMWLDIPNHRVTYHLEWDSLTGPPTAAHFHRGAPGVAGPVAFPIALPGGAGTSGTLDGVADGISDADITALRSGMIYVNVHTSANPTGEIRGQMLTSEVFTAAISPANSAPPVTGSNMMGTGFVLVRGNGVVSSYNVVSSGTGPITMGHIHRGAIGENGPVIVPFIGFGDLWGTLGPDILLSQPAWDSMRAGNMYVNFHTQANPNGEARGQLVPAAANLTPLAAVPADDPSGAVSALTAWYDPAAAGIRFRTTFAHPERGATVTLYSTLGDRIASADVERGIISAGTLANGMYLVQLVADGRPAGFCRVAVVR